MKKAFICFVILSLVISCDCHNCRDNRKFIVEDFSKKRVDTLIPYKNKTYVSFVIRVKGNVDDTIKIKREGYYEILLSDKVDTSINGDYYGTEDIIWTFDPYKAKTGKLEIEYSL